MTLIDGKCPSRDSKDGEHQLYQGAHVTYYDCRGRIMDTDGRPNQKNPRIFAGVAACAKCLTPLVIFNLGFPIAVRWRGDVRNSWRELTDEASLIDQYVIQEQEVALCL